MSERDKQMKVYQIRMKLFMLQNIEAAHIQASLAEFVDQGLALDSRFLEFHNRNIYKNYCFDLPYPIEKDKVYKKDGIYTVTIRTIQQELAEYITEKLVHHHTRCMKGLTCTAQVIAKKPIQTIYTLTPAILKDEKGYWRKHMNLSAFEERLKINLVKKWNSFCQTKLEEEFTLYTALSFTNAGPIKIAYKNINLLGDKIEIAAADNETAQNLWYMALGTGILEMNSRGAGFINCKWL